MKYGPLSRIEIAEITLMPQRTVGFALNLLLNEGLIFKKRGKSSRGYILYGIQNL
ncbi:MAG: hypothetical protein ACP6IS_02935 [Candidatus Asgardarchaeia archaeon]